MVGVGYTEKLGEMELILVVFKRKFHIFSTGASSWYGILTHRIVVQKKRGLIRSTQTLWNCLEYCCEKKVLPNFSFRELPGQFMIWGVECFPELQTRSWGFPDVLSKNRFSRVLKETEGSEIQCLNNSVGQEKREFFN